MGSATESSPELDSAVPAWGRKSDVLRPPYFWSALLLALSAIVAVPVLNAFSQETTNPLIVGVNFDYPPFEFADEHGEPQGYDVDLIRAVAEQLKQPLVIKVGPWSDMRAALTRGEIDVLPGMLYSEQRDLEFDFTASHLTVAYSIFVRKDTPAIASEDDLEGKAVIVEAGSLMHDRMLQLNLAGELIEVASEPEALRLLSTGRYDCALVPYQAGLLILRHDNLANLEPSGSPVYNVDLCMAVKEGNTALRDQLDEALALVKRSDAYRRIYNRWFGAVQGNGIALRNVLRVIIGILLAAALMVGIVLAWSISLRRKVAERTRALIEENRKRQSLEEQLYQSQKMEAIGQLAGGIAHDFNNLLATIIGYTDLMSAELDKDDAMCKDLDEVRQAGEQAAALTRQLLTFSRRQIPRLGIVNLNDVLTRIQTMIGHATGERYNLTITLKPDLACIMGDPSQIEQIALNLVLNARDAMPDGGSLTIATANVVRQEPNPPEPDGSGVPPAVMLEVADSGSGMNEETRKRAFEPFFTTKEPGRGTGLGLSVVYGIVQQHGATIDVNTAPGVGTRFRVFFPAIAEGQLPAEQDFDPPPPPGGTETILVVEDEDSVRELAIRMLRQSGYTVLAAAHGDAAVEIAASHPGPIHLVMSDVVLPRMNGPDVVARIRVSRPDMRVVFMSGYTHTVLSSTAGDYEDAAFIQKPFTNAEFLQVVRDTLNEK